MLLHLSERLQKVGITIIIARMKKQFMDTVRKTGTLEKMGGDNRRFFSRITFALAQAWANVECDKCGNGKNCPLRTSVAIQQAKERGELEPDQPKPVDIA